MLSEILLHLHRRGWDALTPVTLGSNERKMITICFEKTRAEASLSSLMCRRVSAVSHASELAQAQWVAPGLDTPPETLCCR